MLYSLDASDVCRVFLQIHWSAEPVLMPAFASAGTQSENWLIKLKILCDLSTKVGAISA